MVIRLAADKDIPRLICLLRQVGEVHHRLRPDLFRAGAQKYDEKALAALLRDPKRPIFAAFLEEQLVGYAFCIHQITENDPVLLDRRVLYIDDLCVDESFRGRGIAGALYRHVEGYGREQSFDAITLNVWAGNSAEEFYRKMGLKPQKTGMEAIL